MTRTFPELPGKILWLIGSKGMLGTEIALYLESCSLPFIGTDRELDITDRAALLAFAESNRHIGWVINCAAYTAVDKAEDDTENCRLLNAEGAGNIAFAACSIGAKLIHISTDYVFNGKECRPYTEEDTADPIGVYGRSKRDGEIKILEENAQSYIIRTAWMYGKYGNNFVCTMLRLMGERESVSVVNDQRGSPTWASDLAMAVIKMMELADTGNEIPYGIYHFTNEGDISWFDFAQEIYKQARVLGILTKDCDIIPCTSTGFPARVQRPAYSVLDKKKITAALGSTISPWDVSLKKFLVCIGE